MYSKAKRLAGLRSERFFGFRFSRIVQAGLAGVAQFIAQRVVKIDLHRMPWLSKEKLKSRDCSSQYYFRLVTAPRFDPDQMCRNRSMVPLRYSTCVFDLSCLRWFVRREDRLKHVTILQDTDRPSSILLLRVFAETEISPHVKWSR